MNKVLNFLKQNKPFVVFLLVYLGIILLLQPFGNFPINDDWNNQLQVLAFQQGKYAIHSAIDASFIVQPWLGYLWAFIFGTSFVALRMLTVLFSVLFALVLCLLFKNKLNEKDQVLLMLAVLAHPLFLTSSLTFMTEIYFLFFLVLGYFYFKRFLKTNKNTFLFLSLVVTGLAVLNRQLALVSFFAYFLALIFTKKASIYRLLSFLIISGAFIFLWQIYPRAGIEEPFIYLLVEIKRIPTRITYVFFVLPLVAYSIIPITLGFKKNKRFKFLGSLLLGGYIFTHDVLPLGNVFYLECLYCRTRYKPTLTLFDNVLFKYFLAVLISYSIITLILVVIKKENFEKIKKDITTWLLVMGYFFVLYFPEDIYDRYAMPLIVFTILLVVRNIKIRRLSLLGTMVIVFMSLVLNWEFFRASEIGYEQAYKVYKKTNLVEGLCFVDTFSLYVDSIRREDYLGEYGHGGLGTTYKCFVQQYYLENDKSLFKLFDNLEKFSDRYIENPDIYNRTKKHGIKNIKKRTPKQLLYNKQYFSPLYNLVGKPTYVGSFCDEDVKFRN